MWLPLNLLRGLRGVGLPCRSDNQSDYNQARGERSQQQAAPSAARASILTGGHSGASLLSLKSRRPPVSSIQNLLNAIDISLQLLEGKDAGAESSICLQPVHTMGAWEPGLCRAWRAPVLPLFCSGEELYPRTGMESEGLVCSSRGELWSYSLFFPY